MAALKVQPGYFADHRARTRTHRSHHRTQYGQTAEAVGHLFGITRAQSDAYAAESHKRLAKAQSEGWLKGEVETSFARDGKFYDHDDGVRPDSTAETLAKLKPVFERPWGKVTAGNSSQITDGASGDPASEEPSKTA
jgi:acetyl-CoA C-acetyltransferase